MNNRGDTYRIGDVAEDLGLSQRAIRYYEELGFIRPSRTDGGFRLYSGHDVEVLRMILHFKDLSLTLEDIRALIMSSDALSSESLTRLRAQLIARREEFESKAKKYDEGIRQIDRVLGILSNCTGCGKPSEKGVCEECLKQRGEDAGRFVTTILVHDGAER